MLLISAPSQHKTAVQYLPVMQQQFGSLIFFFLLFFFWRWGGGGVSLPPVKTNFFLCSPPPELVHCANTVFGLHTAPGLQVRIVLFVFAFSGNKCVQARTATYKVPR